MSTTSHPEGATEAAIEATAPADRLLAAASKLFAAQGIRASGIDTILRDAGVAKASLYSTFGSKDALILAYLQYLDQTDRNRWQSATDALTEPHAKVLAFFDLAIAGAPDRNFRGCQYANAATEFPDTELPPITEHRRWFVDTVAALLADIGVADPDSTTQRIQVIYDGALSGSKLARSVEPIRIAREMARDLMGTSTRRRQAQ
ncbi:TetR/AcrR family transcriptional regulator [Gordonia humi]|uniref:AcrR family transcriptional regulator n=1 Tax=Gordonia humi TaxID=686429 RepID=A0A840ETN5_9ACTN|nr:TetR/AcrR family transcriptional regulator [Gordonia humi]MBB4133694.1 AcrR family transcriptional regulator [Gordonia humi]